MRKVGFETRPWSETMQVARFHPGEENALQGPRLETNCGIIPAAKRPKWKFQLKGRSQLDRQMGKKSSKKEEHVDLLALLTVEAWQNPRFKTQFHRNPRRATEKLLIEHDLPKLPAAALSAVNAKRGMWQWMNAPNPAGVPPSEIRREWAKKQGRVAEQPMIRIRLSARQKQRVRQITGGEMGEISVLELTLEGRGERLMPRPVRGVDAAPFDSRNHQS